jgi:hypothetical protein
MKGLYSIVHACSPRGAAINLGHAIRCVGITIARQNRDGIGNANLPPQDGDMPNSPQFHEDWTPGSIAVTKPKQPFQDTAPIFNNEDAAGIN